MRTPPLRANFIHARGCKPFCEKLLTLPRKHGGVVKITSEYSIAKKKQGPASQRKRGLVSFLLVFIRYILLRKGLIKFCLLR